MSCNHLADCKRCGDFVEALEAELTTERRKVRLLADKLEQAGVEYTHVPRKPPNDAPGWIKWAYEQTKGDNDARL